MVNAGDVIRDLFVRLGVKLAPGTKNDLRDFDRQIDKIKDQMEQMASAALRAGAALAGAFTAAALGAGKLAVDSGKQAEEINRQALGLRLTREQYQELLHVFQTFGAESDDMADAFLQLNDRAVNAAKGGKEAAAQFGLVGIKVHELRGLGAGELFELLADRVASAKDQTAAMAATSQLLGEEMGRRLAPALAVGGDEIRRLRASAHELGVVLNDEQLGAGVAVSQAWRELTTVARGLRMELGLALAPEVEGLIRSWGTWLRSNRALISQRIETAIDRIGHALRAADRAARLLGGWDVVFYGVAQGTGLLLLVANIGKVEKAFLALRTAAAITATVVSAVLAPAAAALGVPVAALVVAIAALVAYFATLVVLADDFYQFATGGQSAIGSLIEALKESFPLFKAWTELVDAALGLVGALATAVGRLGLAFLEGLAPAISFVTQLLAPLRDLLQDVARLVTEIGQGIIERMIGGLNAATGQINATSAGLNNSSQVQAALLSGAVSGSVGGAIDRATGAGAIDQRSVSSAVSQTNNFFGAVGNQATQAIESAIRKARLATAGTER